MTTISIIAAIDENYGLGKENQLLCYLPNDLKHFKEITSKHAVIMGRKTYDSLPNGALPNRRNIVVSRQKISNNRDYELVHSLEEAIEVCSHEDEVFIIGGASIYEQAIEKCDRLYLTHIAHQFDADVFFPPLSEAWKKRTEVSFKPDEKHAYPYSFVVYDRT